MAVLRMTHVGICVTDLERAIRFYRDGLGFAHRAELRIGGEPTTTLLRLPEVDLHAVYLERDGTRIELLHYVAPGVVGDGAARPMNGRGLTHLSLRVDSVADTVAALRPLGARVLDQTALDLPDFGAAAIFLTDPDGTLIELVQSPGDLEAPPGAG
jgi:catechol 2,3-dioxygenase-like lactoylglutathione lyase family enzyme